MFLTFGKSLEQAKGKIDYVLGQKGSESADHTRHIEWEGWNLGEINSLPDIWRAWKGHIENNSYGARSKVQQGRPFTKTAVHISINEDAHIDFFSFIYDGIWNWVNNEYYGHYMGLVAYHFKGVKFHAHMVINPVPMSFENAGMLRIGMKDPSWMNRYYEARDRSILRGMQKIAHQVGGRVAPDVYDDSVIAMPIMSSTEAVDYSEHIRKSREDLFIKLASRDAGSRVRNATIGGMPWQQAG